MMMRTLLALICSFALIGLASAAQQDDLNNPGKNKRGQAQVTQQQAPVVTPKAYKPRKTMGTGVSGNAALQNQYNVSKTHHNNLPLQSTAKTTTFNKTVNKNITVNKNFKVQKFNLANQPSGKYQAVKFNQNFRIAGAQNWRGSKYVVFQNYHPQWHDQGWWRSHHNHIVFVFGSPYYWDAGYWYPAWGYDPGASYYYDGPIYASNPEMDPGQVVANVQSALQQQGFYQGDIDGVLGPQTRAALAEFQSAQGLEPTGVVDEPTLETLGMV
jgi:hypothetical protein